MKSIQTCTEPHRCGPADVLMLKCLRMDQLRGPVRQKLRGGRRNLSFNVIICVIYYQHVRCSLPSFSAGVTEDRLWPSCSAEFINQGAQFIRSTWFINTFAEISIRYHFCIFSWYHVTAQLLRSRAVFTTQREVTRRDLADGATFSCDVFQETARGEDVSARWKCQMKGFYLAPSEEKEPYSEMFRVWKIQRCNTSGES